MDIRQYIQSGIIETYVLGLCSPEEERELEQLRSQHLELDQAIREYELSLEQNLMQQATVPGAAADERILHTIQQLKPPARVVSFPATRRPLKTWLAVACALLAISLAGNYFLYRKVAAPAPVVQAPAQSLPPGDYAIMNDRSITPVALYGVGTHAICRCTLFWDKKQGKAYVMIHHLVASGSRAYQLWADVEGKMVKVGTVDESIRGRFIELSNVPAAAKAFIVTLEEKETAAEPTLSETYLKGVAGV